MMANFMAKPTWSNGVRTCLHGHFPLAQPHFGPRLLNAHPFFWNTSFTFDSWIFGKTKENCPPDLKSCQRTFFHIFPYNKGWLYFLKTQRNYVMLCSCFLLLWSNLPYFYFNESNLNCHKKTKLLPLHTDDEHKTQRSVNLNIQIDINLYLEIIYTLKYCYNYVDPEC